MEVVEDPMKVLIADDDSEITDIIEINVQMNWPDCQVFIATDGEQAKQLFTRENPDLVILDIAMPPPNGFEVCKFIRERSDVPILMVSGNANTIEKVRALDLGADDYITKPFDQFELLARLRANTRRARKGESSKPNNSTSNTGKHQGREIKVGNVTLELNSRQVIVDDRTVKLTSTECRLLEQLMREPGSLLPYETLLERVWGSEYMDANKYLKAFVWRLRKKLEVYTDTIPYIQNQWGTGYRFIEHTYKN